MINCDKRADIKQVALQNENVLFLMIEFLHMQQIYHNSYPESIRKKTEI